MNDITPLNTALVIFVRHPELGKVKTRLAKVIGDEKAFSVYNLLLSHTRQITIPLNCRKFIYYTNQVIEHDLWTFPGYTKRQQFGEDLGARMSNAFKELFDQGFKRVMIIGSDCYQLQTTIVEQAIATLNDKDVVIGPTFDGGYYLLGSNRYVPELFTDKAWSTDQVTNQTVATVNQLELTYSLTERLHDVDEVADLELNEIRV
ncbi:MULTISPECIES: TIGR04282 family arsenosugar biosynthesis glycosyltransferase [unclassified Mucilaginibacter]|uniref:TIGR04282 family arsenosugar biosynthesis glycosyltransferase n=1 Tax=unclassified Mucilaginibacter TaxID=2617802 RepID=UPI002AC935F1|nr:MULTISPECIES: TIGR04282 family arsenosugar biosynthesis glycosyltransferase [unclassified Mucilaginibacter]MEB0263280.1 TIGR04282 family arsenosugar biosynthesis glycosyltransferase [Mucilaginibacter sp. 10I4]MEB0278232.1 TIGR04282 family arsenosugar biosynthesis glycosyltransferase [Mucilaginibacter sp. 10B2]MEB0300982.1 TIGR04282 family arsenosugar biosynthesis glycosyltransferase [Mucilaginibacter sp. 5C4]WPX23877.1 TIGR04282 family arsenosugar biosynthesis glycosyltransferase [Mucilagini